MNISQNLTKFHELLTNILTNLQQIYNLFVRASIHLIFKFSRPQKQFTNNSNPIISFGVGEFLYFNLLSNTSLPTKKFNLPSLSYEGIIILFEYNPSSQ